MSATSALESASPPPPPVPATADLPSRWTLWSDRLNPILVREVQQAVKGRAFALTVLAALAISVIIAIVVARDGHATARSGRNAFSAGLATLVPLLLFVVPMQAYQSMRLELRAGIVEQLFLSRLRPRSILAGKLVAAMVQFGLYVSVLAPLLATSYLLRGVDLPTIALSLLFALVFSLAATAAAISAAAQGMAPALQPLANVAIAFGLGMGTFGMIGWIGSGEYLRDLGWLMRSAQFGMVTSLVVIGTLVGTVLSGLVAQSFLMHAFENRATGFRIFLFAVIGVAFGWMLAFVDAAHWFEVTSGLLFFLVLLGTVFGVFMVTEQQALSPRVRAHVPQRPILALLAAPFLPGRDRGLLCLLGYFVVLAAVGGCNWPWLSRTVVGTNHLVRLPIYTAAYAMVYLSLGKLIRSRLPSSLLGNHAARFLLPLLLILFLLVPVLVDIFVRGEVDDWHVGHVMNPFWTISEFGFTNRHARATTVAATVLAVVGALQIPSVLRGLREVLAAAAGRRAAARDRMVQDVRTE